MPGDVLLQVNEINVSRTQAKAVQKLMKFVITLQKIKTFISLIEIYHYQ
jgi:hypothetical protein